MKLQQLISLKSLMSEEKLHLGHLVVLMALNEKSMLIKEVIDVVGFGGCEMTRVISLLEDRGWVKRTANASDLRCWKVSLTTGGAWLAESLLRSLCDVEIR